MSHTGTTSARSSRCCFATAASTAGSVIAVAIAAAVVVATTLVASTHALLVGPPSATTTTFTTNTVSSFTTPRTRISSDRDIMTPDPIPQSGIDQAVELMKTGRLYRYNAKNAHSSVVSKCELEIAQYTGHKYCVALNSCGSAIMLMMKCAGMMPGDEVLCNAFTFGAVPSAIEHAGGKAVYVESDYNLVMDIDDLEKKLVEYPNCKFCLISHMRGKLADMDAVKDACDRHGVVLLEDCAHSLGAYWKGKHSGHVGKVCAISSQSYKMINSGEGGFLLTDDADVAAKCAVYAGAYERLAEKHITVPDPECFPVLLPTQIPNYSLRMSELTAAVIRPQILTLDERRERYNTRYDYITKRLAERVGHHLSIPVDTPGMIPVHDSLQFNLSREFTEVQVQNFLNECAAHGLKVDLFGNRSNARNFVNWKFAPAYDPLPLTTDMLNRACDVRLPLMWDEDDFSDLIDVICESIAVAVECRTTTLDIK